MACAPAARADLQAVELIDIARCLNREGLSAAPLPRLSAISFYDDEFYENYDIDLISPSQRLRIARALSKAGFRQISGRRFAGPEAAVRLAYPRLGILGADPLRQVLETLGETGTIGLLTSTQSVMLYLERFHDRFDERHLRELEALVWEQPANLDKVGQWSRRSAAGKVFRSVRPRLEQAQAEGIDLRRRRQFRSRLPGLHDR